MLGCGAVLPRFVHLLCMRSRAVQSTEQPSSGFLDTEICDHSSHATGHATGQRHRPSSGTQHSGRDHSRHTTRLLRLVPCGGLCNVVVGNCYATVSVPDFTVAGWRQALYNLCCRQRLLSLLWLLRWHVRLSRSALRRLRRGGGRSWQHFCNRYRPLTIALA